MKPIFRTILKTPFKFFIFVLFSFILISLSTVKASNADNYNTSFNRSIDTKLSNSINWSSIQNFTQNSIKILNERYLQKFKKDFTHNFDLLLRNTFFLKNYNFVGHSILDRSDIINIANLEPGFWLWQLDLKSIKAKMSQLSWVKSVDLNVGVFPSRLNVLIDEYEPFLLAQLSNRLWVVSSSGELISPIAEIKNVEAINKLRSLPRLKGLSDENNWLDETYLSSENARYHHAVRSLRFLLKENNFPFRIGFVQLLKDGSLKLSSESNRESLPKIILNINNQSDSKTLISSIKKVLSDLSIRDEVAQSIDLRFKGRAIVK